MFSLMAVIAFLSWHELHWRFFKFVVMSHVQRVAKEKNLEGLVYLFAMRIEFNFKEIIFDRYGFWGSFKYAFDHDLKNAEFDKWYRTPDTDFRLPTDKQIVVNTYRGGDNYHSILIDGKWVDSAYMRVDRSGLFRNNGKPTSYIFNFSDDCVYYFEGGIKSRNVGHKIGSMERVSQDYLLVQIKPH